MAAAVYLHNALFGRPSPRSLHDNDAQDEDDHDDADNNHHRTNSGESSSSYFDAQEELGDAGEEDALRRADPHRQQQDHHGTPNTWSAPTYGSSNFASTSNYSPMSNSNANEYWNGEDAVDDHGRKFSISSQATLVPSSRPTTTSSQSHLYVPQQRRVSQQHQPVLSTIQASESEGPHSSSHAHEGNLDDEEDVRYTGRDEGVQLYRSYSAPEELMEGAGEVGDDPSYSPTSRSSPLPPGLPAYTSHTSTAQERGRPKTPYPFPSVDNEDASPNKSRSNSNNQPSQPSDSNKRHRKQSDPLHTSSSSPPPSLTTNPRSRSHSRTRPKGRRRHTKSISDPYAPTTTTTSDVQPRIDHIQAPDQQAELPNPNPLPSPSQRIRSEFFRRRGRIPNSAISRTKRFTILVLRLLLGGAVLGGWAAYSCARYWLAYSEFRPTSANPKEDPPRSQYAFVLAIICTVATGLLFSDLGLFLYLVFYPQDKRPLFRTSTITPIRRAGDDNTTNLPASHLNANRASSIRHNDPLQFPDNSDKFTSLPYRNSGFSSASSYRRSRRLSKTRPESFMAFTYPPPAVHVTSDEEEDGATRAQARVEDEMADRQLAGAPAPDSAAALNGAGANDQRHSTRPTVPDADASSPPPTAVDNRPSQYVPDPSRPQSQVVEDHPMAEKQSKSTYALHFPSLCHDSSISPLPPPMTHTAGRYITPVVADTAPKTKTSRMKKWYKTRIFLHVVHWIIFILVNIPGFVNVALVPLWYDPPPVPHEEGGGINRGVNSPHRLAGLCDWSPDVIWAGTARPPAYPPPCAQTVPYRAWLWGAIGRVLITFFISVLWVIMDGIWWGSWVVGTRNIGWGGAVGRPWHRRRVPAPKPVVEEEEEEGELDSDGDRRHEIRESALARRIRLLSVTSKASGKSGRSGSNKEKLSENEGKHPMPRREAIKSTHSITSVGLSAVATAPAATEHTNGSNSQHKVRRKPVRTISPSSPLADPASLSETSPPTTSYGSPMDKSYFEQTRPMGGLGSRRPSAHESIGGSTVVGSPPGPTFLPASPPFFPTSPPMSSAQLGVDDRGAQSNRRSIGLDIVPEDSNSSPEQEGEIRYPERPPSRLARYDDNGIYGQRPSDSPEFPMYHPSMTGPGWAADPSMFSPATSPGTQAPLLGRNYFMVGDGGFLAGNPSEGAYDEDSYYRAMSGGVVDYPVIHQDRQRATSPHSERSSSPTSYGHGNLAGVDLRVETPTDDDEIDGNHQYPAQTAWYPIPSLLSASQQAMPYQHPLAQGIQIAMGRPIEPMEREVRMLGGVIRRMSTIESFGSHERELSRRGSGATARTTQTGRGNSAGTAAREGTNGSSNSGGHQPAPLTQGSTGHNASGSGGQVDRSTEDDNISGIVRASSPVEMTNPEK